MTRITEWGDGTVPEGWVAGDDLSDLIRESYLSFDTSRLADWALRHPEWFFRWFRRWEWAWKQTATPVISEAVVTLYGQPEEK